MKNENSRNELETHQIIPMSARYNQRDSSLEDIQDFVGAFDQEEVQNRINQAIETCLTSDSYHFEKPIDREDLLYIMRNISKAVRALYVLFDKKAA